MVYIKKKSFKKCFNVLKFCFSPSGTQHWGLKIFFITNIYVNKYSLTLRLISFFLFLPRWKQSFIFIYYFYIVFSFKLFSQHSSFFVNVYSLNSYLDLSSRIIQERILVRWPLHSQGIFISGIKPRLAKWINLIMIDF